jgi:hypothetical protein
VQEDERMNMSSYNEDEDRCAISSWLNFQWFRFKGWCPKSSSLELPSCLFHQLPVVIRNNKKTTSSSCVLLRKRKEKNHSIQKHDVKHDKRCFPSG